MITTYYGVVQPWLCDTMGHLTTRHYVGMFDDAHFHFYAELGANLEDMLHKSQGFADVKSTLEYKRELGPGALVEIRSRIVRIGTKSFVHRHEMYEKHSGELVATMENVTVAFDLKNRRAVPVYDEFRVRAEQSLSST